MDYKKELERILDEVVEEYISEDGLADFLGDEYKVDVKGAVNVILEELNNENLNEIDEHFILNNLSLYKKLIKSALSGDLVEMNIIYNQLYSRRK